MIAIKEFQQPNRKDDMQFFLGLEGIAYFILEFSTTAAPLSDLTKKDNSNCVKWGESELKIFDLLKRALASGAVLHGPDFTSLFLIQTDPSGMGGCAVLTQLDRQENE